MEIAINKYAEDKESQKKRIEYLKAQTAQLKQEFIEELAQVKQEDIEYSRIHNQIINMNEYYRNACQYVIEKENNLKRSTSHTYFPSLSQNKFEGNENGNSNEQVLNQVKSSENLSSKGFFRNRMKKSNNLFSPQRTRNNPFMKTTRTTKFSTVDRINVNPEKIDSLITK